MLSSSTRIGIASVPGSSISGLGTGVAGGGVAGAGTDVGADAPTPALHAAMRAAMTTAPTTGANRLRAVVVVDMADGPFRGPDGGRLDRLHTG